MYKAVTSSKICVENKNKPIYICGFSLKIYKQKNKWYKFRKSKKLTSLDMVPSTDSVNNFLKFAPSMMHVGDGV